MIILGVILALTGHFAQVYWLKVLGLVLIVVGLVLLFVPGVTIY